MRIIMRARNFLAPGYKSIGRDLKKYFRLYGGYSAILKSPYLHVAFVISALSFGSWREPTWWSTPIGVLPNLIGFTLGGYAILISFGNDRFVSILTEPVANKPASVFMAVNATFVHFIFIQVLALLLALVAQSRPLSSVISVLPENVAIWLNFNTPVVDWMRFTLVRACWFISYTLFLYAVVSTIAGTMAIFWLGGWFERLKNRERAFLTEKDLNAVKPAPQPVDTGKQ